MSSLLDKPVLRNPNISIDTEFGLHVCSFTGKRIIDEKKGVFVEVALRYGIVQYVKVLNPFPIFSAILKNSWFDNKEYKGLYGYVAFVKGEPSKGVLVGVSPTPESGLFKEITTSWTVATENFNLKLDDKNNVATLTKVANNDNGKIHLGNADLSSHEAMLLGSTTLEKVAKLHEIVVDLANAFMKMTVIPASLGVPTPPIVNISEVITVITKLTVLKSEYSQSLSKTNFLSK